MTIPLSGEVYGLTHHLDQEHGLLLVLFWRPNQLGTVNATAWTGLGKWYALAGEQEPDGTWTWSPEQLAFSYSCPRPDLSRRGDGVLEAYLFFTTFQRCKSFNKSGPSTWA
jgi:hypothetical protein